MRGKYLVLASLALATATVAHAQIIYQTGFENPPFVVGPIAGQDSWSVFGTAAAVTIQTSVVKTGTQAVLIDASLAPGQTGPWRNAPFDTSTSSNKIVTIDADVYLASGSTNDAWQFAALSPNLSNFIAGFNALVDGTLQLITPGFPVTGPVITRDTWMHYTLRMNFAAQTFDVLINNSPVATSLPIRNSETQFGSFIFDTFYGNAHGANDKGYLDNLSIQAEGAPNLPFLWFFFS